VVSGIAADGSAAATIASVIPVFRPSVSEAEIAAVTDVLRSGWWGLGPVTRRFEERFAALVGAPEAVGMSSGSAALHAALVALGVAGRSVITPSLTFVGANHVVVHAGATPIFADVDPVTLCLDPADVERRIDGDVAAVIATDYGGHPARLDRLRELCDGRGIALVEDAAHAAGASLDGCPVGSLSTATCFSFHAVKTLAMGEGGAVTTADPVLAATLRRLRWFGIDRDTWSRSRDGGYAWDYDVEELGFKSHLSDVAAAIGLAQLERFAELQAARRRLAEAYTAALADVSWLTLPVEVPPARSSWHLYAVRLDDRDRLIDHLTERGIASSVHYRPSHTLRAYAAWSTSLPVTEREWRRLVTLPLFPDLTPDEQGQVIEAVRSFQPRARTG
jgi:perosamine synthetase